METLTAALAFVDCTTFLRMRIIFVLKVCVLAITILYGVAGEDRRVGWRSIIVTLWAMVSQVFDAPILSDPKLNEFCWWDLCAGPHLNIIQEVECLIACQRPCRTEQNDVDVW